MVDYSELLIFIRHCGFPDFSASGRTIRWAKIYDTKSFLTAGTYDIQNSISTTAGILGPTFMCKPMHVLTWVLMIAKARMVNLSEKTQPFHPISREQTLSNGYQIGPQPTAEIFPQDMEGQLRSPTARPQPWGLPTSILNELRKTHLNRFKTG